LRGDVEPLPEIDSAARIIKSHEYSTRANKKVIYIVRDPRDVALSYYDFSRKYRQIDDSYPLPQFVSDFVAGRLSSFDWGTWGEMFPVGSTRENGRPEFLLLRYERHAGGCRARTGQGGALSRDRCDS